MLDKRAPFCPTNDRKFCDPYGWPLGKWQSTGRPKSLPAPPRGTKRAWPGPADSEPLLPEEDHTLHPKARQVISKLITGALECEEESKLTVCVVDQ